MRNRLISTTRALYEVLKDAVTSYGRDRVGRMAAAIAYRTMFAVAPILLIATGVFGLVVGDAQDARERILAAVEGLVGIQVAMAVQALVTSAVDSGNATAVIGLALFAWASSSLFMDLQMSLNDIFGVPQAKTAGAKAFARRRLIGVAWALSIGVLLISLWLINSAWTWLAAVIPVAETRPLLAFGARVVTLAMLPLVFALMYRTMTRARLRRRAVWVGGVVTSVAFLATAVGAGAYFSWGRDPSAPQIAASLVVLLLAAYLLSSAVLFGAQVTRAIHDRLQSQ